MDYVSIISLLILFFVSYLIITNIPLRRRSPHDQNTPPEPTKSWPVIGHLPVLAGPELPHRALAALADKYGPIFTLRLGIRSVLVVSSSEIAKELFTAKDTAVLSRPLLTAFKHLTYDFALSGLGPYNPYWREMRKIKIMELLSNRRLELHRGFRESEVEKSTRQLYRKLIGADGRTLKMELKEWVGDLTLNVMLKMIKGMSHEGDSRLLGPMREFFHCLGMFVVGDAFPFLGWMDIGGHVKRMKRVAGELDELLEEWLVQHKTQKNRGIPKTEHDFMDVLLSVLPKESLHGYEADTIIKATSLSMISGGTDTTTVTLTWAFALLLNNRHVLLKAQEELDRCIPKERAVREGDIEKLVYLQAIVKETMRLYPAAPLLAPRQFIKNCDVGGYNIQEGTWLMVNAWKIQTNPNVWPNPMEFKPERFLTTHRNIDMKGQSFDLFPFGSGRRACPGMNLGLQMTYLILASFLQAFDISTPRDEPVDMGESFGLSNMKATPLDVVVSPRLSLDVYA